MRQFKFSQLALQSTWPAYAVQMALAKSQRLAILMRNLLQALACRLETGRIEGMEKTNRLTTIKGGSWDPGSCNNGEDAITGRLCVQTRQCPLLPTMGLSIALVGFILVDAMADYQW